MDKVTLKSVHEHFPIRCPFQPASLALLCRIYVGMQQYNLKTFQIAGGKSINNTPSVTAACLR